MRCERCGWELDTQVNYPPPDMSGLPPNLPPLPPLPTLGAPHTGACPSPYRIGQEVWWDLGGATPDLPPVLGYFTGLAGFAGPSYVLEGNKWSKEGAQFEICAAKIKLLPESVLQEHLDVFSNLLDEELEVRFDDLTVAERWPVLT